MTSKELLDKKNLESIKFFAQRLGCPKHVWVKYGFGYKCTSCEEYTGTNLEVNKLIEEELKNQ